MNDLAWIMKNQIVIMTALRMIAEDYEGKPTDFEKLARLIDGQIRELRDAVSGRYDI